MTIRVIIQEIIRDPDATVVNALFTDDLTFKTSKQYRLTNFNLDSFKAQIRSQIDSLSQVDNVEKVLSVGEFDPSPSPLSPEDQAKQKFFQDLAIFRSMQRAVTLGLLDIGDKLVTSQFELLKGEFLPNYIGLI